MHKVNLPGFVVFTHQNKTTPMTKRFAILSLFSAALCATPAIADDYGVWLGGTVQKDFSKKLSADVGLGMRAENKLNDLTRYDIDAGLTYKPLKWLSISGGYTFIRDYNLESVKDKTEEDGKPKYNVDDAYWRSKHRATFDVSGSWNIAKFGKNKLVFTVRERYQYTHFVPTHTTQTNYRGYIAHPEAFTGQTYYYNGQAFSRANSEVDPKRSKHKHYLRSRFGLEYDIRHCAWTPYATYEFSNNLSDNLHLDKQRLTVGVEWKVAKQHRLDFAYVYNHGADDDNDNDCHALSVGYKFKF